MTTETLEIRNDFDLAIARSALRRKAAERRWHPRFRARATAALGAMANLILAAQSQGAIDIGILEYDSKAGVEFTSSFRWPDNRYVWLVEVRGSLVRVADEMEIRDTTEGPHITIRVWLLQGE